MKKVLKQTTMINIKRKVYFLGVYKGLGLIFKPANGFSLMTLQCLNCLQLNPIGVRIQVDRFIAPICIICDPLKRNSELHDKMHEKLQEALATGDYKIAAE